MIGDSESSRPALDPRLYALTIDQVSRQFTGHLAVDNVSLSVAQGEFVTLLGPSGCGKTTILRMVAGFETPTSGVIRIGGADMAGVPPYRRPIGIVFQNLALFPHMTVAGNLAFGLETMKLPKAEIQERVDESLALIGLSDLADRRVHQISGGQRQRVALARALVRRPTVLLLDEPLGALDLKIRRQLQLELKRIQKQVGTTFVFVTHDQEEALTMSDRIAVMNEGRIEQVGTPIEIYHQPRTAFVANFVGDTNFLSGKATRHPNGAAQLSLDQLGVDVALPTTGTEYALGESLSLSLRPENVRIVTGSDTVPSRLEGTVSEVVYAGAQIRYTVRVGANDIFVSVPTAPSASSTLKVGEAVRLGWAAEDCVIHPADRRE